MADWCKSLIKTGISCLLICWIFLFWQSAHSQVNQHKTSAPIENFASNPEININGLIELETIQELITKKSREKCELEPGTKYYPLYPYKEKTIKNTIKQFFNKSSEKVISYTMEFDELIIDPFSAENIDKKVWQAQLKKQGIDLKQISKLSSNQSLEILQNKERGGSCMICIVKNALEEQRLQTNSPERNQVYLEELLKSLILNLGKNAASRSSGRCLSIQDKLTKKLKAEILFDQLNKVITTQNLVYLKSKNYINEYINICKSYNDQKWFQQKYSKLCTSLTNYYNSLDDLPRNDKNNQVYNKVTARNSLNIKQEKKTGSSDKDSPQNLAIQHDGKNSDLQDMQSNELNHLVDVKFLDFEQEKSSQKSILLAKKAQELEQLKKELEEGYKKQKALEDKLAENELKIQNIVAKQLAERKIPNDKNWNKIKLHNPIIQEKTKNQAQALETQNAVDQALLNDQQRELFNFQIENGETGLYSQIIFNHYNLITKKWESKGDYYSYSGTDFKKDGKEIPISFDWDTAKQGNSINLVSKFGFEIDPNSFEIINTKNPNHDTSTVKLKLVRNKLGMYLLSIANSDNKKLKIKYRLKKTKRNNYQTDPTSSTKLISELPLKIKQDLDEIGFNNKNWQQKAKIIEGYILQQGLYSKHNKTVNDYVEKAKNGEDKVQRILKILTNDDSLPENIKGMGMDCDMYAGECYSAIARDSKIETFLVAGYQNRNNSTALETGEYHGWTRASDGTNWVELNPTPAKMGLSEAQKIKIQALELEKEQASIEKQQAKIDEELTQENIPLLWQAEKFRWKKWQNLEKISKILDDSILKDNRVEIIKAFIIAVDDFLKYNLPTSISTAHIYLEELNFYSAIIELLIEKNPEAFDINSNVSLKLKSQVETIRKNHQQLFKKFPNLQQIMLTSDESIDYLTSHNLANEHQESNLLEPSTEENGNSENNENSNKTYDISAKSYVPKKIQENYPYGALSKSLSNNNWQVFRMPNFKYRLHNLNTRKSIFYEPLKNQTLKLTSENLNSPQQTFTDKLVSKKILAFENEKEQIKLRADFDLTQSKIKIQELEDSNFHGLVQTEKQDNKIQHLLVAGKTVVDNKQKLFDSETYKITKKIATGTPGNFVTYYVLENKYHRRDEVQKYSLIKHSEYNNTIKQVFKTNEKISGLHVLGSPGNQVILIGKDNSNYIFKFSDTNKVIKSFIQRGISSSNSGRPINFYGDINNQYVIEKHINRTMLRPLDKSKPSQEIIDAPLDIKPEQTAYSNNNLHIAFQKDKLNGNDKNLYLYNSKENQHEVIFKGEVIDKLIGKIDDQDFVIFSNKTANSAFIYAYNINTRELFNLKSFNRPYEIQLSSNYNPTLNIKYSYIIGPRYHYKKYLGLSMNKDAIPIISHISEDEFSFQTKSFRTMVYKYPSYSGINFIEEKNIKFLTRKNSFFQKHSNNTARSSFIYKGKIKENEIETVIHTELKAGWLYEFINFHSINGRDTIRINMVNGNIFAWTEGQPDVLEFSNKSVWQSSEYGLGAKNTTLIPKQSHIDKSNWLLAKLPIDDSKFTPVLAIFKQQFGNGKNPNIPGYKWHQIVNNIYLRIIKTQINESKIQLKKLTDIDLNLEADFLLSNINFWFDKIDYTEEKKIALILDLINQADEISSVNMKEIAKAIKTNFLSELVLKELAVDQAGGFIAKPDDSIFTISTNSTIDSKIQESQSFHKNMPPNLLGKYSQKKYFDLINELTGKDTNRKNW